MPKIIEIGHKAIEKNNSGMFLWTKVHWR